ncbi:MAG: sensor domain-containing diguanylate cyclase [Chloroflexota bacterium]
MEIDLLYCLIVSAIGSICIFRAWAQIKTYYRDFNFVSIQAQNRNRPSNHFDSQKHITEGNLIKAGLANAQQDYQQLLELAPGVLYDDIIGGKWLYIGPNIRNLCGYTAEELYSDPGLWLRIIHPEDRERLDKEVRALCDGDVLCIEYRIITKDRGVIWVHDHGVASQQQPTSEKRLKGILEDITQRKRADELRRESETNFRAFFETMTDIIVVGAPDGRILFANSATYDKLGYSLADLAAMHILDLHPADKRAEAEEIFASMLRGERSTCPLPLTHKDGSLVPVETRAWFGRWNGEDCIFGISKDLTAEQESQQRFERLFRNNPALMALSTIPDRRFFDVNNAFLAVTGYTRNEVLGKTSAELGLSVQPEQHQAAAQQLLSDGQISHVDMQIRCKDGTIRDGLFWGEIIHSQGRDYFLTVMIDITERKQAERALRESEEKFRAIIDQSTDSITLVNSQGRIVEWNRQQEQASGIPRSQAVGKAIWEVMTWMLETDPRNQGRLITAVAQLQAAAQCGELTAMSGTEEVQYHLPDGSTRHSELHYFPVKTGAQTFLANTSRDITERKRYETELQNANLQLQSQLEEIKQLQKSLRDQATRDPLTGLYNRRYMEEMLKQECTRAQRKQAPLSVVILDLDRLKQINDTYGHVEGGDQALQTLAETLKKVCRAGDTLCRYGGDEFLVILYDTPARIAYKRATQWQGALNGIRLFSGSKELEITFSAGIAEFPLHGSDEEELTIHADRALYHAKKGGRDNIVLYTEELGAETLHEPGRTLPGGELPPGAKK